MQPAEDVAPISLKDIAAILLRRKLRILLVFFSTLAAVVAVTFLMPKQYLTQMKVLVKNERADTIVSPDPNSGSGYRGEVGEARINSEIELLTGKNLLRQVVLQSGLDRLQHSAAPDPAERRSVAVEKALKRLESDLKVTPVRKADIIQVEYTDPDPRRAVLVLDRLAELYLEQHLKVHGTPGTYEFFKRQAERYRLELGNAEAKLAEFRRRENIVMLAEQKDTLLKQLSDAESSLVQAEAAGAEDAGKIANIRAQLSAAAPRVVTQSRTLTNQYSVERLHTMLAELQNRRTQLLAKFRPDDRLVRETDQELADTRVALENAGRLKGEEQTTDVNPLRQALELDLSRLEPELRGLRARRASLARQAGADRLQLVKLAEATAAFDNLTRTRKETEDNYLLYTKKAEEARIAEALDQQKISNVAIAETPVQPHLPAKPNVRLNLALGAFLACFLSLGVAFAAEYFRDAVEQPAEIEDLTGLPVLAASYGD